MEKASEKEMALLQKKKAEPTQKVFTSGVGKFINPSLKKEARRAEAAAAAAGGSGASASCVGVTGEPLKKKKRTGFGFSDFSGW